MTGVLPGRVPESVRIWSGVRCWRAPRPTPWCQGCSCTDKDGEKLQTRTPLYTPVQLAYLLEHHVVVGVVEGVASHYPHQPRMHHGSVGGPAQGLGWRLDAGQHPEGLRGGNGEGAVRTWVRARNTFFIHIRVYGSRNNLSYKQLKCALSYHWAGALLQDRLLHPSVKERYRRSSLPAALWIYNHHWCHCFASLL